MIHGTYGGYTNHGCRCADCRKARSAYMRNRQPTRRCSIDGCNRAHVARGWCKPHWRAWRLYGSPLALRPWGRTGCSVPGCPDPHCALGLCKRHYMIGYNIRRDPRLTDHGPVVLDIEPFRPVIEQLVTKAGGKRSLSLMLGLDGSVVHKWLTRNHSIDIDIADRLCIMAGAPFADLARPWRERKAVSA